MECNYENVKKIVEEYVDNLYNWREETIESVLQIVNNNFKYPPRGYTEEYRIPEDVASGIAYKYFGVNAYE